MQKQKNKQRQVQVSDLIELIDDSYRLDVSIKENKKVLDKNKKKLKELSEGRESLSGELGEAIFSNDTKTEIEPKDLYLLLCELGQDAIFFELVSVKIGPARERIGDMMLEKIWKQSVKKNAKIKFKKRS